MCRTVIGRHIRNIHKEEELERDITCAKFAHMVGIDNLSTRNDKKLGKVWVIQLFSLILHASYTSDGVDAYILTYTSSKLRYL